MDGIKSKLRKDNPFDQILNGLTAAEPQLNVRQGVHSLAKSQPNLVHQSRREKESAIKARRLDQESMKMESTSVRLSRSATHSM